MILKKYRHIFFDLDHTLWDFETNSRNTVQKLFEARGLAEPLQCEWEVFYQRYLEVNESKWALYRVGRITKARLRAERFFDTFKAFGLEDLKMATDFEQEYLATCPYQSALLPGSREVLDYLSGEYKLHILTNGFHETQTIKLRESGIADYFDNLFASDVLGANKPDRKVFGTALGRAGANRKDTIMIGDNLAIDVLGARNSGLDQIYYNPRQAAHNEKITFEISELLHLRDIL